MRAQSFAKGVLSVGLWTVTKTVASALTIPFLTRILGAEGYGQYAYYLALLLLLAPLSNFGSSQSMNRNIPLYPNDRIWQRGVARIGAWTAAVGALFGSFLLVAALLPTLPEESRAPLFLVILVGAFVFDLGHWYGRGVLYGLQREELAGIPASIGVVLGSVAGVILAYSGLGLLGAIIGLLFGNVGVAVAVLWLSRRALSEPAEQPAGGALVPRAGMIIGFGLTAMVFSTINMILYKSGIVLTHRLLNDDSQTGLFAAALQMAEFVWIIPLAVEAVMLRTTTPLWQENRPEEITRVVSRVMRYMALLAAGVLLPVGILGDAAMKIYFGEQFADAAPALRVLVPGVFSYSLSRMLWPVLQARGTMLSLIGVTASAAAANLLLCLLLIPRFGILGTAVAVSVTYGSMVFLYARLLRRAGVHPFRGFHPWRFALLVLVSASLAMALRLVVSGPVGVLVAGTLICSLSFWLGAVRLGLFRVEEAGEIIQSLPLFLQRPAAACMRVANPFLNSVSPKHDAGAI